MGRRSGSSGIGGAPFVSGRDGRRYRSVIPPSYGEGRGGTSKGVERVPRPSLKGPSFDSHRPL